MRSHFFCRRLRLGIVAIAAATLSACTTVGPDFVSPDAKLPAQWQAREQSKSIAGTTNEAIDPLWWNTFGDSQLTALEQRALAQNLSIQIAQTHLLESRAARRIVSSAGMPTVGANASYSRSGASNNGLMSLVGVSSAPPASAVANGTGNGNAGIQGVDASRPFNLYQGGFDASWEVDFWGRTRRAVEAADANSQAAIAERRGVMMQVLAETGTTYVQLRATQATLATMRESLDLAEHSLRLTKIRRAEGVSTNLEVSEAAALVGEIEANLPDLEQQQSQLINALALLVSEAPGSMAAELGVPRSIPPVPEKIPLGLPSDLARRRPDILQAEALLHAATANIGVAKADFYPSLTLSGSAGLQSLAFGSLSQWGARQFAIGPSLYLPIFSGGRLTGNLVLREAEQQEAALRYQQTVLSAWHEIDDVLIAYDAQQRRNAILVATISHNKEACATALARYKAGSVTFLDVLVVQRGLLNAQINLVRSTANVSLTAIRLYKALGGGWEVSEQKS